ncbi:MAG: RpiB/LacA/LacB family sugar-phosphate isomerase [Mobilitalea sp.]
MTITVGSDHAGYNLKIKMIPVIEKMGYQVIDQGCDNAETPVFFHDIARVVCQPILDGKADKGIMFCGTGVGASIACNKIPGIRSSIIHDIHSAHQAVEHDHVQVMCIGEKIVGEWLAPDLIKEFIEATGNVDERTKMVIHKLNEMDGSLSIK